MTQPRKHQVSLSDTPYYHIVSRCVRRTFLCGVDQHSGRSYEHRRQWIEERIRILSSLFAIDLCSYAVMSNHYHLVVKLAPEQADDWSFDEVIQRWMTLYKGPLLVQRYQAGETLSPLELSTVSEVVASWKKRLVDLSWFMKCLNEPIARAANKEDDCTGHFWEARFKSQALLDESALLACMVYVDLNPIRAGMAATPEESEHTSIKERITPRFDLAEAIKAQGEQDALVQFGGVLKPLLAFDGMIKNELQTGIPFPYEAYLELVDWTGRAVRDDKRGAISHNLLPILQRLSYSNENWLKQATQFEALYRKQKRRKPAALPQTA